MSAAAMADLEQQKATDIKETEAATLPVAGEEQMKLTQEEAHEVKEPEIDLQERDPNQLNDYVKVSMFLLIFTDFIAILIVVS